MAGGERSTGSDPLGGGQGEGGRPLWLPASTGRSRRDRAFGPVHLVSPGPPARWDWPCRASFGQGVLRWSPVPVGAGVRQRSRGVRWSPVPVGAGCASSHLAHQVGRILEVFPAWCGADPRLGWVTGSLEGV